MEPSANEWGFSLIGSGSFLRDTSNAAGQLCAWSVAESRNGSSRSRAIPPSTASADHSAEDQNHEHPTISATIISSTQDRQTRNRKSRVASWRSGRSGVFVG